MTVITKELSGLDRCALESHFFALDQTDRRLRFGAALPDNGIVEYVSHMNFDRDAVFGVFDDELRLAAAAHLARAEGYAELGVSVLPRFRGRGLGSALLGRAHMHARNWGVPSLFMHCLSENGAMLHLARKQGMHILVGGGEADARLALPPGDSGSFANQILAERVGLFDYTIKSQLLAMRRFASAWSGTASKQEKRGESEKDEEPA